MNSKHEAEEHEGEKIELAAQVAPVLEEAPEAMRIGLLRPATLNDKTYICELYQGAGGVILKYAIPFSGNLTDAEARAYFASRYAGEARNICGSAHSQLDYRDFSSEEVLKLETALGLLKIAAKKTLRDAVASRVRGNP
jgi:hypothetical protein